MSPVRVHEKPCVEVTCDRCKHGHSEERFEHGVSGHWGSVGEAARELEELGWKVVRRPGGEPFFFYCPGCWAEITRRVV